MQETSGNVIISAEPLTRFCTAVFMKLGVPPEQAAAIAGNLVQADLEGVASHGVVRLPIYAERLRAGVVNPQPNVRITRETATTAVVDGDNGMGQWVGVRSRQWAIEEAPGGARLL